MYSPSARLEGMEREGKKRNRGEKLVIEASNEQTLNSKTRHRKIIMQI